MLGIEQPIAAPIHDKPLAVEFAKLCKSPQRTPRSLTSRTVELERLRQELGLPSRKREGCQGEAISRWELAAGEFDPWSSGT